MQSSMPRRHYVISVPDFGGISAQNNHDTIGGVAQSINARSRDSKARSLRVYDRVIRTTICDDPIFIVTAAGMHCVWSG